MDKNDFDVIVIGAGSGGLTSAVGATKAGKKVLLVERDKLGGECTNAGCIPSKALLHRAREYAVAKKVSGEGTETETFRQDSLKYVHEIVKEFQAEETPTAFETIGMKVVIGEACFKDQRSIIVNDTVYHYKTAIIATGSSPRMMSVPGLNEMDVLTNQNLFKLDRIPDRLLIIGAGGIGLEMAHAFGTLGSKVTLVAREDTLANRFDPAIQKIVTEHFAKLGVEVLTKANLKRVENRVAYFGQVDDEEKEITTVFYDKILLAIGRIPNLPTGLAESGIDFQANRGILVDQNQRTTNHHVYALGDVVAGDDRLTHVADTRARGVVTRLVSRGWLRLGKPKAVPKVLYTEPEIAQVGMSYEIALQKYGENRIRKIETPLSTNDRAKTTGDTNGVLIVVARRLSGAILGAQIVAPTAGDLIAIFSLAIEEKISLWKLHRVIYAYPTYSLLIKKAGDVFLAKQLASLKKDLLGWFTRHLPKLIAALFWGLLIYSFHHYRITNELTYQAITLQLFDFFTGTAWGPILYMILYAIRPLILFPATLLTALSGALFGFWWGVLYTIVGENASANLAYWIGRFFGHSLDLENTRLGSWIESLRTHSFETVMAMRLFYVPFDLTNYGSGVVKAKWREYALATLIGIMPGLLTFVALGAALDLEEFRMTGMIKNALNPTFLAISVIIFIASLLLSRWFKHRKQNYSA